MHKRNKGLLIAFISIAIVCVLVLVIGVFAGGEGLPWVWENNPVDYDEEYSYSCPTEKVNSIKVNWINGKVDVRVSDKAEEIVFTEYASKKIDEKDQLHFSVDTDGQLEISWRESLQIWGWGDTLIKELVVEIPKELADQMEELDCSSVSGEIEIKDISVEYCKLDTTSGGIKAHSVQTDSLVISTVSGRVELAQLDSENTEISTTSGGLSTTGLSSRNTSVSSVSGEISLKGEFPYRVDASSTSGDISIQSIVCPDQVDLDSIAGEINLKIPENQGFTLHHSTISGRFSSNFALKSGDSEKTETVIYEDGKARFDISTTSAGIIVNILDEK